MAPKKKRGAPASASKPVPPSTKSKKAEEREAKRAKYIADRKAKSERNKKNYAKMQAEETAALYEERGEPMGRYQKVVQGEKPRPVKYDVELGRRICLMFATDPSMSLLKLNRDPELPTVWTFYEWLRDHPDFEKVYARARELHADIQAAEMEEWAERPLIGTKRTVRAKTSEQGAEDSEETQEYDNIERARLRVATRQWLLARLRPRKYGAQPAESEGGDGALQDLLASFRVRDGEVNGAS